jgi:hypothetical protein
MIWILLFILLKLMTRKNDLLSAQTLRVNGDDIIKQSAAYNVKICIITLDCNQTNFFSDNNTLI